MTVPVSSSYAAPATGVCSGNTKFRLPDLRSTLTSFGELPELAVKMTLDGVTMGKEKDVKEGLLKFHLTVKGGLKPNSSVEELCQLLTRYAGEVANPNTEEALVSNRHATPNSNVCCFILNWK